MSKHPINIAIMGCRANPRGQYTEDPHINFKFNEKEIICVKKEHMLKGFFSI